MKTTKFLSIILVALFCYASSCKPEEIPDIYPISLGEQTIVGKIVTKLPLPSGNPPPPVSPIYWLETNSNDYIITIGSFSIWGDKKIIVNDIEYFENDEVKITGEVKMYSNQSYSINIETIEKIETNLNDHEK